MCIRDSHDIYLRDDLTAGIYEQSQGGDIHKHVHHEKRCGVLILEKKRAVEPRYSDKKPGIPPAEQSYAPLEPDILEKRDQSIHETAVFCCL